MFEKIKLALQVFRQGQEVADPKLWKDRQNAANVVAGLLGSLVLLAIQFGYELPITTEELAGLALFIGGLGNWVFTTITSRKVGVGVQPVGEANGGVVKNELF